MSGNNPKPTAATLDNLKSALGDLQVLQSLWKRVSIRSHSINSRRS
jgi:hypothetical protein